MWTSFVRGTGSGTVRHAGAPSSNTIKDKRNDSNLVTGENGPSGCKQLEIRL